jgi:glycosyltransferase involved in cell wall biosynthesis
MHHGAVENWLVRMLRHARENEFPFDWTFYCTEGGSGSLAKEAQALGATVICSPVRLNKKASFVQALRLTLLRGRYDVLHCHHDIVSAMYLLASIGTNVGMRIVHVHNADESALTSNSMKAHVYRALARRVCLRLADRIVGISNHTLDTFLAGRARRPGVDVVHYYGVNPAPFEKTGFDRAKFRTQLDLPPESIILLFAGRLVPEKNPTFVVDVLAAMRKSEPRVVALFAGSGADQGNVLDRVKTLGIEEFVRFLGWRDDVPKIMGCSDLFILPRPDYPLEGFGLAVVEAQLAGLPMLLSHGIPDDPLLVTACYARLPLAAGAGEWAKRGLALLRGIVPPKENVFTAFRNSPMELDTAQKDLLRLYE